MVTLLVLIALVVGLVWVTRNILDGPSMAEYQSPEPSVEVERVKASAPHDAVFSQLKAMRIPVEQASRKERLSAMRKMLEDLFNDREVDAQITPVDVDGLKGEWVCAPGALPDRRFLYIHGGAFTLGSPLSHRGITSRLSAITRASVFSLDYRLMPEHPRMAGITDCRRAWQWLAVNGPEGESEAESMFVGGDSAGGNLTLMLLNWIRDRGLRAPDAALALAPATDSTFQSPSLRANIGTDAMLGAGIGRMMKLPRGLLLWLGLIGNRMTPSNPLVSPLRADLSHLPPVLVQASSAEMLFDDAVRWVNKARASGSPAQLQVWPHTLHGFQAFEQLPEADEAYERIGRFFESVAPVSQSAPLLSQDGEDASAG